MTVTQVSALLVDHPALPVPVPAAAGLRFETGEPLATRNLSRNDRLRFLAQLLGLTAVLGDLDLWPGQTLLRRARWVDSPSGTHAVIAGMPRSMTRLYDRLGRGERAARLVREAAISAACNAAGLPPEPYVNAGTEPGCFVDGCLQQVLAELSRPLDAATARCLWGFQWDLPSATDEGGVTYWSVASDTAAARLAAAMWLDCRRRGDQTWIERVGPDQTETAPLPPSSASGTMIVVGEISQDELSSAERWARRPGSRAVLLGRFPRGWNPPPPPVSQGTHRRLVITGIPLDRAGKEVERRAARFDPFSEADCAALTDAAAHLFTEPDPGRRAAPATDRLAEILTLLPDGLTESFLVLHSGLAPDVLRRRLLACGAVRSGSGWRLASPQAMRCHPLHAEVAALFPPGDPRRFRHQALAGGDPKPLLSWARQRLDQLAAAEVRLLLGEVAPGELGQTVDAIVAEACLTMFDLSGARNAVQVLPAEARTPWQRWLDALDPAADRPPPIPAQDEVMAAPRAAAEVSLRALRKSRVHGGDNADTARRLLHRAMDLLSDALRRWFAIELAALDEPHLLCDRKWRREIVADHPQLLRLLLHKRALGLIRHGNAPRWRAARRLLQLLDKSETSPGRRGLIQTDLALAASDAGQRRTAAGHDLRAYRLLVAAGFRHRTRLPLFNLASGDIDSLRIDRAEDRFRAAQLADSDAFLLLERCRMSLARGDEEELQARLADLPADLAARHPQLAAASSFLRGAGALLRGDRQRARAFFAAGGSEGEVWLGLVRVLDREALPGALQEDGWGVGLATLLTATLHTDGAEPAAALLGDQALGVREAFALALVERLLGRQAWLLSRHRSQAEARLLEHGLRGWARVLRSGDPGADTVMEVLAELAEASDPASLQEEHVLKLLAVLELTGLEVRSLGDGRVLWQVGEGSRGPVFPCGHLCLVPLGGEPRQGPAWRLFGALLEMIVPVARLQEGQEDAATGGFLGVSAGARSVQEQLRLLAPSGIAVALLGETGVGKEVAAKALHRLSGRSGRFVPVNMAGIPGNLLEAELFGAVKGAFTGADRTRRGLADAAAGGTLFLDEIGDLDLPLQVKLLRFLESREVRQVGSDQVHEVDVRIVCATNRDLDLEEREGRFRADLRYRIASAPIVIPPLRERRDDIPLLRSLYEQQMLAHHRVQPVRWSREAEAILCAYHWPGNVRELGRVVELAMVRAAGGVVHRKHLDIAPSEPQMPRGTWDEAMAQFRRNLLTAALQRNNGNRSAAARELGISRQTLLYHLRNLGLRHL